MRARLLLLARIPQEADPSANAARVRAAVPRPVSFDFVKKPQSRFDLEELEDRKSSGRKEMGRTEKIARTFTTLKKKSGSSERAHNVSVEGRDLHGR